MGQVRIPISLKFSVVEPEPFLFGWAQAEILVIWQFIDFNKIIEENDDNILGRKSEGIWKEKSLRTTAQNQAKAGSEEGQGMGWSSGGGEVVKFQDLEGKTAKTYTKFFFFMVEFHYWPAWQVGYW